LRATFSASAVSLACLSFASSSSRSLSVPSDRLELLTQVVLPLRLVHLPLHLGVDLVGELEDLELAVQQLQDVLEPGRHLDEVQDLHLLLDGDVQVGRDQIGEMAGVVDALDELRRARRDLGHQRHDLARRLLHVHHQRLDLERIGVDVLHLDDARAEVGGGLGQAEHPEALQALEDEVEAFVPRLERLHDAPGGSHLVQVVGARVVDGAVALGDDADGLSGLLDGLHHRERLGSPDRDRHDAAGEEDGVAEREDGDVHPLGLAALSETIVVGHVLRISWSGTYFEPDRTSRSGPRSVPSCREPDPAPAQLVPPGAGKRQVGASVREGNVRGGRAGHEPGRRG
jgi:hypothetical protein